MPLTTKDIQLHYADAQERAANIGDVLSVMDAIKKARNSGHGAREFLVFEHLISNRHNLPFDHEGESGWPRSKVELHSKIFRVIDTSTPFGALLFETLGRDIPLHQPTQI